MFRACACALIAAVLGCGRAAPRAGAAGLDDFGEPVSAGSSAHPARIVSLNPALTQLLYAEGAGPRVVGRSSWDLWSDSVRRVRDLGAGIRPNVEAVFASRPDLVLLYASADNRPAAGQLRAAGIAVLAIRTDRIEDFARAARLVGLATGESARAAGVVDSVERTLARVRRATAGLPEPRVFWHVWDAPIITIGRGSYLDELLQVAGGRNIYGGLPEPSPQVALEDVIRRDPDVVLAGADGAAVLRQSARWQAVAAVHGGRVLVVDTALVGMPSVRMGEAAVSLARLLHPGALP